MIHAGRKSTVGEEQGLENFEVLTGEIETHHPKYAQRAAKVDNANEERGYMKVQMPSATVMYEEQAVAPEHEDRDFTQAWVTSAMVEHDVHIINHQHRVGGGYRRSTDQRSVVCSFHLSTQLPTNLWSTVSILD